MTDLKPYTIEIERKFDRPKLRYRNILAKDRDDAIDFVKRVHRVDFHKVISCRQEKGAHSPDEPHEDTAA